MFNVFRYDFGYCFGGCGETYWGDWYGDPPDCNDPCDTCGNWTGGGVPAGGGYAIGGHVGAPTAGGCSECGGHAGAVPSGVPSGAGQIVSQTDRVVPATGVPAPPPRQARRPRHSGPVQRYR